MKKTGRICGVCGDIGQIEKSAASSVGETASENTYCAQAPTYQPIWCCQTCKKKQTEMAERRKSDIGGPMKRFENSKVKFLSSKDVISLSNGPVKPCIKTSTTSVSPSIRTAPYSGASTPTQTLKAKNTSECLLSSEKMLFGNPAIPSSSGLVYDMSSKDVISLSNGPVKPCIKTSTTSVSPSIRTAPYSGASTPTQTLKAKNTSGCKEMGHKLNILKGQLPYHIAPIWKGSLEVPDLAGNTLVDLVAYLPLQVSSKLYSAIEALPTKLRMKMVPQCNALPKQLKMDFPNLDDVGVYIRPLVRSSSLKWTHLLRQLDSRNHALKMNVNGCLEFVVHSSQVLVENSQKIGGDFFLWGFFWKRKMRSVKKKKQDITPSRTRSQLLENPNFRTPIAQNKRANIVKHNQVDKEAIADTADVCENNSLEKEVVADTFNVSPGLSLPSAGQEPSPMDRQSETSMQGKETQPTYKVAPGCSPVSHIADKVSDCVQTFSIIGVGSLEATFESCKNREECPEAPSLTDANQIEVECENPLIPLPVGLEMPPGFSREEVETREKSISNRQLESPPCFDTFGQVLIKQEKEPLDPQPGGLEIPPGFFRRIETKVENNIPPGSSLSTMKALNVPRSVPDNFMDKPLLKNQGIVHQKTSVGQSTVVFSYPVLQETRTPYSAQPTNLGEQRAIQQVSLSNSQTILDASFNKMVAQSQNESRCLPAALPNANAHARTSIPRHFRVFHSSFVASNPRNASHPSIKEAATAREEGSQREMARRSPSQQENRSRRHRSCSTSPVPRRRRSRSRSTNRYGWNGNGSHGRSPVRPCNLEDSGRYSNHYKSSHRSRSRGDFHSFDYPASRRGRYSSRGDFHSFDYPASRRGRYRSRSPSPPPPADSS